VQTIGKPLSDIKEGELRDVLLRQRESGLELLRRDSVPVEAISVAHEADMHYEGQRYTLRVSVDPDKLSVDALRDQLKNACFEAFGIDLSSFRPKIANLRTAVIGVRPVMDLKRVVGATHRPRASAADARVSRRDVWFGDRFVPTDVYQREWIPIGAEIAGPAIINQMDSTTVIEPGDRLTVDGLGNLMIQVIA
jgi:N-methylhydantoinase A